MKSIKSIKTGDLIKVKNTEGMGGGDINDQVGIVVDIGDYITLTYPKWSEPVHHDDGSTSPGLSYDTYWIEIMCKHTHNKKVIRLWIMDCAVELIK